MMKARKNYYLNALAILSAIILCIILATDPNLFG